MGHHASAISIGEYGQRNWKSQIGNENVTRTQLHSKDGRLFLLLLTLLLFILLLVSSFCAFFRSMVVRISSSNAETMVSAHQALTLHWLREFSWCVLPPKAPVSSKHYVPLSCVGSTHRSAEETAIGADGHLHQIVGEAGSFSLSLSFFLCQWAWHANMPGNCCVSNQPCNLLKLTH